MRQDSTFLFFFFSSRRRHTRCSRDWSSDVCSSDLSALSLPPLHATRTGWGTSVTEPMSPALERDHGGEIGMEEPGEQLHAGRPHGPQPRRPPTRNVRPRAGKFFTSSYL